MFEMSSLRQAKIEGFDNGHLSPVIQLSGIAPSWTETHVRLVFALFGGAAAVRFLEISATNGERVVQVLLKKSQPENLSRVVWQLNNTVVGDDQLLEECRLSCSVVANSGFFGEGDSPAFVTNSAGPVPRKDEGDSPAFALRNASGTTVPSFVSSPSPASPARGTATRGKPPEKHKFHIGPFVERQEALVQRLTELGQRQMEFAGDHVEEQRVRTDMMRQMSLMLEQHSQQQSELISMVKTLSSPKTDFQAEPQLCIASNHAAADYFSASCSDPVPAASKVSGSHTLASAPQVARRPSKDRRAQKDVGFKTEISPEDSISQDKSGISDDKEFSQPKPFSLWRFLTKNNQTSLVSMVLLLLYLSLGICFFVGVEEWGVGDTIYFSAVVMTTVGYGDFLPTSDNAKLFTCGYVIFGLVIDACAVSNIADAFAVWAKEQMRVHSQESMFERNMHKQAKRRHAFLKELSYLVILLLVGMNYFANFKDWEGEGAEGDKWVNSLYLSVITVTTVGFGDFAATTDSEKAFTVIYMLVGIPVFAAFLQGMITFFFGQQKDKLELHLIKGGPTPDNFHNMLKFGKILNQELGYDFDASQQRVDRFEFLACVVVQNGLLTLQHIKKAMKSFESMDSVQDGFITAEDVENHFKKRSSVILSQSDFSLT